MNSFVFLTFNNRLCSSHLLKQLVLICRLLRLNPGSVNLTRLQHQNILWCSCMNAGFNSYLYIVEIKKLSLLVLVGPVYLSPVYQRGLNWPSPFAVSWWAMHSAIWSSKYLHYILNMMCRDPIDPAPHPLFSWPLYFQMISWLQK